MLLEVVDVKSKLNAGTGFIIVVVMVYRGWGCAP